MPGTPAALVAMLGVSDGVLYPSSHLVPMCLRAWRPTGHPRVQPCGRNLWVACRSKGRLVVQKEQEMIDGGKE